MGMDFIAVQAITVVESPGINAEVMLNFKSLVAGLPKVS